MNLEEGLDYIETQIDKRLNDLQKSILRASWEDKKYSEIAQSCDYTLQHVKDVGYELWQFVSQVFNEKIDKRTFKKKLQQIKLNQQDWGISPDVSLFFGREQELTTLKHWIIEDRCRLVVISGMGGIGKTQLSVKLGKGGIGKTDLSLKLAKGIQYQFEYVFWRSILNTPSLKEILTDLIKFLSNQQEIQLPKSLDKQIFRLVYYLRQHRCLIILDNVDTLLQSGIKAGQYQQEHQGYAQLFECIGEVKHQSCFLLTSREKPENLERKAGIQKPIRFLELSGLDYAAGKEIFNVIDCFRGSEKNWQEIIDFYNGNPLALELAASHIKTVFSSNIAEFLREEKTIFYQLQNLLDWHWQRLSKSEQEVLYWLAINREPVSIADLKADIINAEIQNSLPSIIQSLQRRLPLEKTATGFSLQPVLIEYLTNRFVKTIYQEIKTDDIQLFDSHALIKATAKDYIRENQIRFILKPISKRLIAEFGNFDNFVTKVKQILLIIKQKSSKGYTSGNILNLLFQVKTILKDYDFSGLTIRQAFLQGITLNNVNFTNANFLQSVFTQSFNGIHSATLSLDGRVLAIGNYQGEIILWSIAECQQISILKKHNNWINVVNFSPDGRFLASSSHDNIVKLWDVKSRQCIATLSEHTDWSWSLVFSPDSQTLATANNDGIVRLWDLTGNLLHTFVGHNNWVVSIAFSSDGKILASGSFDGTIKLWDVRCGKCLKTLRSSEPCIWSIALNPKYQILASGSQKGVIEIWNINTGECCQTLRQHSKGIRPFALTFSPDGKFLASASFDTTVKLWQAKSWELWQTLSGYTGIVSVSFSSDSQTLIGVYQSQKIKLWDCQTGQILKTIQAHLASVRSIAWHPNNKILASASQDDNIRLWDTKTGKCVNTLPGHTGWVWSVAFSPDGQTLVSGSDDACLKLWSTKTGQCLKTFPVSNSDGIHSVAFSTKGQLVASSDMSGIIRLWDIVTGECLQIIQAHQSWIWSIIFSPDGKTLVSSSDDFTIKLWDINSGDLLVSFPDSENPIKAIRSIAFSPKSNILVSGSDDGTVRIWDISKGKCLKIIGEHNSPLWSVAFSPDGNTLASGDDAGVVKLWDIKNSKCLRTLSLHFGQVMSIAFSKDGKILASSGQDETIRLWEVNTGKCLQVLRNPRPYEGTNILGVKGLREPQKQMLKSLGAVEKVYEYGY